MQLQKQLADIAARVESGEFFYTRFFAIGIFRLLELTESRDPKALEGLIKVISFSSPPMCSVLIGIAAGHVPDAGILERASHHMSAVCLVLVGTDACPYAVLLAHNSSCTFLFGASCCRGRMCA